MEKQAATVNERLKLESASLESILPTLNGPAIAVSSVGITFHLLLVVVNIVYLMNNSVRAISHCCEYSPAAGTFHIDTSEF